MVTERKLKIPCEKGVAVKEKLHEKITQIDQDPAAELKLEDLEIQHQTKVYD